MHHTETIGRQIERPFATKAAAAYLGLSASWLEKARVHGTGPVFFKLGRRVVYRRADLDAWLAAKRRCSTSGDS